MNSHILKNGNFVKHWKKWKSVTFTWITIWPREWTISISKTASALWVNSEMVSIRYLFQKDLKEITDMIFILLENIDLQKCNFHQLSWYFLGVHDSCMIFLMGNYYFIIGMQCILTVAHSYHIKSTWRARCECKLFLSWIIKLLGNLALVISEIDITLDFFGLASMPNLRTILHESLFLR
jgi:hypothetical protein